MIQYGCYNSNDNSKISLFSIPKETQEWLMIEGCQYNKRQRKLAEYLKSVLPTEGFDPYDSMTYDLSQLLEELTDDEHDEVFQYYLTLVPKYNAQHPNGV